MIVYDAKDAVVGRLAAKVVKSALKGEDVVIVNCEKAVISGQPEKTYSKYYGRRQIQNKSDPEHSQKWPRRPDYLLKRIISGMVPKKTSGRLALKKIMVYIGVPKEYEGAKKEVYAVKKLNVPHLTISELAVRLGFRKV